MTDRQLGDPSRPLRVAIVGSGPSAFYAAEALFKVEGLSARVDVFDRLPTPYGLVRGGVAPDHQKIKNVIRVYEKIAAHDGFRFFGNVTVGRDLGVAELKAHYDQIVWAVGNESDRKMEVPGEDLAGVHSATEFVGWYNGHPDFRDRSFDLQNAERVVVVGNGNVAMDVTRILVQDPDVLATTDISEKALAVLRRSAVREVVLLGRRGPAQAAFSPKEIEEIGAVADCELVVSPQDAALDDLSRAWLEQDAARSAKRNVEFLQQVAARTPKPSRRRVVCRFLVAPVELSGGDGRVERVRIEHSELYAAQDGTPRPRGTGRLEDIETQLVFKAIGYRGVPVPGVPFDERAGVIPNDGGRVLDERGGKVVPGQYVVGWAKRGPTGLIGTNSPDSKATVEAMVADLRGRRVPALAADDAGAIVKYLRKRGVDFVTFADWQALDAWEQAEGTKVGKVRQKLDSVAATMRVIHDLRAKR